MKMCNNNNKSTKGYDKAITENARSNIPTGIGSTLAKVRNPWRFARANAFIRIWFGLALGSNSSHPVNVEPMAMWDLSQPSDASAKSIKILIPSAHLLNTLTGTPWR